LRCTGDGADDGEPDAPESSAATIRLAEAFAEEAERKEEEEQERRKQQGAVDGDVDGGEGTDGGSASGADAGAGVGTGGGTAESGAGAAEGAAGAFAVGSRVELKGLKAKPELNGQAGLVVAFVASSGRFSVTVDGGKGTFDLRPQNLKPSLAPHPSFSTSVGGGGGHGDPSADAAAAAAGESVDAGAAAAAANALAGDGICAHCRLAQRAWWQTLRSRRQALEAMAVSELRRLAGDTETDMAGCTGKARATIHKRGFRLSHGE